MYKEGAVLKITVRNFVTYTYAELYPGPKLNMIIGPNGTGKSTMVAAIILGLGGNPKIIGRGTKVSEYVKHGCTNASIEILLRSHGTEDIFTIEREFDVYEKTTWKLNNTKSVLKDILRHIKQYNIQVDNLCQFLPQDRVQDFAKMDKQELLKQTKKALCRDDLLEKQQNLIDRRERHKALLAGLNVQVQKLQELRDMNMRLEGKVENFNKRKTFQANLKHINRKIAWLKYELLVERRDEIKADNAQAVEVLVRHTNAAKPIETAILNAQKSVAGLEKKKANTVCSLKTIEKEISNHLEKLKRLSDSLNTIQNDMQTKLNHIEDRESEINSATMKLDQLHSDKEEILNKHGDENAVREKVLRFSQEIRKISSLATSIEQKKDDISSIIREKTYQTAVYENDLRRLENVKQQRLEWLRKADADAYDATVWLRENRNRFRGDIYEPMMIELNVTNQENAKYIENAIPFRDRIAFTCTLKEDVNLLIRLLRDQQRLSINVVHSGDEQPPFQSYQPKIPIEHLKQFGLYAYLHCLFTGPEPIMKYLCKTYRIYCTAVGNEKTNRCFEDVPREIMDFFSDKFRFSTSYSKYTGEKSTRQNEIRRSDGSLSVSIDAVQLDHIRAQIAEAKQECETHVGEIQELDSKVAQLHERNVKLTAGLQALRNSQQQIATVESRIRMLTEKLQHLKEQNATKEGVKEEANNKIQSVIKQQLAEHLKMRDSHKAYTDLQSQENFDTMKLNVCRTQVTFLENKALDIRRLRQEAEETLTHIKDAYNTITATAKAALQTAKNLSNGCTPVDEGFEEFKDMYDKLSNRLEELETEKQNVLSKIDCLNTADDGEMREYETRVKQIDNLESSINNTNVELNEITANMDRLKKEYMEPLEELVSRISQKFSIAFERMDCAGEVHIYTGENDKDYEQYGLSIRVTYRNGEPLQELNNVTQSGGERAVATAAYMLSLQELTPVPFRCVDEINQGMDATNERRIFELLVDSTSQENSPQYFLITPKLIQNLKYVPSMKIHSVHNGPFVCLQQQWNTVSQ